MLDVPTNFPSRSCATCSSSNASGHPPTGGGGSRPSICEGTGTAGAGGRRRVTRSVGEKEHRRQNRHKCTQVLVLGSRGVGRATCSSVCTSCAYSVFCILSFSSFVCRAVCVCVSRHRATDCVTLCTSCACCLSCLFSFFSVVRCVSRHAATECVRSVDAPYWCLLIMLRLGSTYLAEPCRSRFRV